MLHGERKKKKKTKANDENMLGVQDTPSNPGLGKKKRGRVTREADIYGTEDECKETDREIKTRGNV